MGAVVCDSHHVATVKRILVICSAWTKVCAQNLGFEWSVMAAMNEPTAAALLGQRLLSCDV